MPPGLGAVLLGAHEARMSASGGLVAAGGQTALLQRKSRTVLSYSK